MDRKDFKIPPSQNISDRMSHVHTDVDADFCSAQNVSLPNDEVDSKNVELFTDVVNEKAYEFARTSFKMK